MKLGKMESSKPIILPELLPFWSTLVINKKLLYVKAAIHIFDSKESSSLNEIEFVFEGDVHGKFYGSKDAIPLCSHETLLQSLICKNMDQ